MALAKGVFIVGAKRTPFCKYGGSLRELPASHAFAAAAKSALQTANLDPAFVDENVIGNVNFLSQCDGGKTPRYCGIYSGVPIEKPALGVIRSCGTGLQALVTGALSIQTGSANIVLTGGTENMSSLPLLVRNARFGISLGTPYKLEDHIQRPLLDSHAGSTSENMAEDVAKKYTISREDVDAFALQSHLKWKAAHETGVFKDEIAPVKVHIKKKEITVDKDEITNKIAAIEDLAKLPPLVDGGSIVTIANSSGPSDGAASVIIASEQAVQERKIKPLARVVGYACVGVGPEDAGMGAAVAVQKLIKETGKSIADVDLFEINETFASQNLACARALHLDPDRVNTNGGAIALGHPVAASGARLLAHLVHELRRRDLSLAVAAASCGGGQGIAVMLERL